MSIPFAQTPPLGIIEGYYGRPWSWEARGRVAALLAGHGYEFFLYAPKADEFLRRRWREPHPKDEATALAAFAGSCRALGLAFGVGLSPFEIYLAFDSEAKAALSDKLAELDSLGVQRLAILFDDMRGDLPDLAARQADILHWIGERTRAERLIMCPTYYSDDRSLDTYFGARPEGYLEALGASLDPAIEVFWTGPEVCSRELKPGHLSRVAAQLGRRPLLWDNYPVNDGPRMSPYLYLRAFTGRSAAIAPLIAGHAVNPALQPTLSCIPALTLAESYALGEDYDYGAAFRRAASEVLGAPLAAQVERRLVSLQDVGLDNLGEMAARLRARFEASDHPGAREIVAWLDGAWRVTREEMEAS
ncbi:MAG: beta-N-acetylglucosaminidase domain-containing protein [Caulobacteraceae bacterium]|nr:beta-N-acetylglucosaminidase domain-containing protein [Caulobacteraceae bacterium]